jgi:hypothetical protein
VRRLALAGVAGAVLFAGLAGCGTPSKDLFLVERSGEGPGASLTLLVSDDGSVRCNGSKPKDMGSKRLIDARGLEHDLVDQAGRQREFRPGKNSVLSYTVRFEDGTISFSDTSPNLPSDLFQLAAFTRELSKQVCRLPR